MQEQKSEEYSQSTSNKEFLFATPQDFEELVKFAISYHESAPDFFGEYDLPRVVERMAMSFARAPAFIYKVDGEIVGAIVLDKVARWWSTEEYITDLFMYIKPEHRSYSAIKTLLEQVKEYAIMNNNMRVELTIFNPNDLERKTKLMNRLGFKTMAVMFENKE